MLRGGGIPEGGTVKFLIPSEEKGGTSERPEVEYDI
jgi:hypothetical protein